MVINKVAEFTIEFLEMKIIFWRNSIYTLKKDMVHFLLSGDKKMFNGMLLSNSD